MKSLKNQLTTEMIQALKPHPFELVRKMIILAQKRIKASDESHPVRMMDLLDEAVLNPSILDDEAQNEQKD